MATALNNDPHAIKIVDINNGLLLNVESLRHLLLQDDIKDTKVSVISVAGAFRQGKSFLLNFFIRYLNLMCKEKRDMRNWLRPEDGPVKGFSWKGGSNTVTNGILIWSEVFLTKLTTGEELAVVLLDTQGSFDNETTVKNCAAIFALSTLISSVQIYNLKDNIKSSDLDHLQFFLGYGRLLRESGSQVPFQNLLFLIRDWATPEQYPFGMGGGNQLLQKVLSTEPNVHHDELIALRRSIIDLFERISCFLLPHPGLEVTKIHFNGDLNVIEKNFKDEVEILAHTVLSPQNLVPKVINGEPIRMKNLVKLFENYCHQFRSSDMPKVESIFMATAHTQHAMAMEEAEAVYDTRMASMEKETSKAIDEELLQQEHFSSRNTAVDFFLKKKIIGGEELKVKNKMILQDKLDERFKVYVNLNEIKLQKERELEMQKMYEEQKWKIVDLEEEIDEEKQIRDKLIKQHNESIQEQQEKISDLKQRVDEEKEMRQAVAQQNQESLRKLSNLEEHLEKERRRMKQLKEEQDRALEEQRKKLDQMERKMEEERRNRAVSTSSNPVAMIAKGLTTAVGGVIDAIFKF